MAARGQADFVDELAQFAGESTDAELAGRLGAIGARVAAPLRVAVCGRPGVGRRTVARALTGARRGSGLLATVSAGPATVSAGPSDDPATDCDVLVHVIAEVVKPEDSRAIAAARAAGRPVLVVLNKADVCGFSGDGPIAVAQARCRQFSALLGVPVEPMIGLLAVAASDDLLRDGLWGALGALARHPRTSHSLDGSYPGFLDFLAADGPVAAGQGPRLLETLDLFGTALAVAAVQQRNSAAQVGALLRRVSRVDAVVERVAALGAELRYRRVFDAVAELEALAASWGAPDSRGELISEFLLRDATVLARMAAAVDLAEALGLADDSDECPDTGRRLKGRREDPGGHLPRAAHWQRYSRGQVTDLHRACGADIARGSLRLWSQAGGSP